MPRLKKLKLYLDTSLLGFSINAGHAIRKAEANLLLRQIKEGTFIGGYSFLTEDEVKAAPPRLARKLHRKIRWAELRRVRVWARGLVQELAESYCDAGAIPEEYLDDARHVAIATLWGADALVSFNFAHLVRLRTIVIVNAINERERLKQIIICQPREVLQP